MAGVNYARVRQRIERLLVGHGVDITDLNSYTMLPAWKREFTLNEVEFNVDLEAVFGIDLPADEFGRGELSEVVTLSNLSAYIGDEMVRQGSEMLEKYLHT